MRSLIRGGVIRHRQVLALLAVVTMSSPAFGADYKFGDLNVSLDTTVYASVSVRTSSQSCDHISIYNGGCAAPNGASWDVNADDGDINVERGQLISAPLKVISEMDAKWQNLGFFLRGKAFWDPAAYNLGEGDGQYGPIKAPDERRPLQDSYRGDDAYNRQLRQLRLLDAFAYGNFNVFDDMPLNVRIGRQAVNWGESLFIPGGVSSYLPLDVASVVKPGTELKEIFLPQNTLYASLGLPANLTLEGMYIMEWDKSPLPPCGTFFSPSDALADGCAYAMSSGEEYTTSTGGVGVTAGTFNNGVVIPRRASINAREQGQWGAALRYYADWLNQGTDLGFYFVNFHDKLPIGTFTTDDNGYFYSSVLALTTGGHLSSPICQNVNLPVTDQTGAQVKACKAAFGADAALGNKNLLAEYPSDIKMFGGSFNTTLDIMNGTAFSGEIAYYPDMPFQIDTTEILGADAINAGFVTPAGEPSIYNGTMVGGGEVVPGYHRTKSLNGQYYTISTFTPSNWLVSSAGADILLLVTNAGFQYLPTSEGNRFAIPRSSASHPNPGMASVFGDPCIAAGTCTIAAQYATTFSWGYRVLAALQYNSALGTPLTITPRVFFAHDVKGFSAGPVGPGFVEGVKTLGLGVDFSYKDAYKLSLDYATSFGNRYRNAMADKDYASAAFSYAF